MIQFYTINFLGRRNNFILNSILSEQVLSDQVLSEQSYNCYNTLIVVRD